MVDGLRAIWSQRHWSDSAVRLRRGVHDRERPSFRLTSAAVIVLLWRSTKCLHQWLQHVKLKKKNLATKKKYLNLPGSSARSIPAGTRWSGAAWNRTLEPYDAGAQSWAWARRTPLLWRTAPRESRPSCPILGIHSTQRERRSEEVKLLPAFVFTRRFTSADLRHKIKVLSRTPLQTSSCAEDWWWLWSTKRTDWLLLVLDWYRYQLISRLKYYYRIRSELKYRGSHLSIVGVWR